MAYRIENARPEHIPGVCEAHRTAVLSVGPGPYTAKELEAWAAGMRPEKMERVLAEEGITLLVAADDAGVAGFILFAPTEVKALYVHPGHAPRRADQPPGCRIRGLDGAFPPHLPGHGHRRHPWDSDLP